MPHPDSPAAKPSLTESQGVYLRLVAEGLTSKQIAQRVGGSHHTINAEIGIAMRVLGAKSRQEAARLFVEVPSAGSYEPSYETAPVAGSLPDKSSRTSEGAGSGGPSWPWPTKAEPENTLGAWQRVGWIVAAAAVIALLLGGLASGVTALLDALARWV